MQLSRVAVGLVCLAVVSLASIARADVVTAITTVDSSGTPDARTMTDPAGTTVNFDGTLRSLSSMIDVNAITWVPTASGQVFIRRSNATEVFPTNNPNQTVSWNLIDSQAGSIYNVRGEYYNDMSTLFNSNSILTGTDNVFSNQGNGAGNNNNIERIDYIFAGGMSASDALGFMIMERGATGAHDGFSIAAITGLTGSDPTNYGSLVTFGPGGWGTTNLTPSSDDYTVLRYATAGGPELESLSSTVPNQPLGGNIVTTTELVSAGTQIFGYSLFATDVTGNGLDLVDYLNATFFPTNTPESAGGLDIVGLGATAFSAVPVPEPSTWAMLGLASMGLGCYLRRRKARERRAD